MRIAVIGNGSIGRRHLKNCTHLAAELDIEEVSGFDLDPARREQAASEIPAARIAESLESAVDGADVIFMCVPTSLHMPVYQEVRALGDFHYFVEKPLSHTIEGCEDMVFRCERAGKVLHVGYMLRYHPVLLKAREIIESGKLGRVLSVRAEAGFYLPYWHPWEDYRDFYMSWKTGGGGALLDITHEINYLQWLFGPIDEVKGYVDTISDLEITSDDIALGLMRFKNGIYGQVQLDLLQFEESRYCKVIGTEGVMRVDLPSSTIRYNTESSHDWETVELDVEFDTIYHTQLSQFVAACRGEESEIVSGRDALATMEIVEAIRRSHAYATTVRLPIYD